MTRLILSFAYVFTQHGWLHNSDSTNPLFSLGTFLTPEDCKQGPKNSVCSFPFWFKHCRKECEETHVCKRKTYYTHNCSVIDDAAYQFIFNCLNLVLARLTFLFARLICSQLRSEDWLKWWSDLGAEDCSCDLAELSWSLIIESTLIRWSDDQ